MCSGHPRTVVIGMNMPPLAIINDVAGLVTVVVDVSLFQAAQVICMEPIDADQDADEIRAEITAMLARLWASCKAARFRGRSDGSGGGS